jgi:hypothetical protein
MNDERREQEETARIEALFRADPGPTSSELIAARLKLKRALARGAPRPTAIVLPRRRIVGIAAQAAGFALLVAALAPIAPRLLPKGASAPASVDLVAQLVGEARAVGERLKPWLPSLPSLPPLPLPSLHSDAR